MKKMIGCIIFLFCAGVARAEGLTLRECYALTLKRSEAIAIQGELIKETEGLMLQSLSTALPKVAFAYSQKWQDARPNDTFGGSTPEAKFTFSQPLFTGFKEFAAISASKHLGKQRAQELKRAKELLFTDVSDAFYLYLSYQQDLEVLETTHKALEERVAELVKRQTIGKSRPSEVASAQSKLLKNEATTEGVRSQRETAGQLMEFLIGQTFDHLIEEDAARADMKPEDLYMKADGRADVVAARESVMAYKNNVTAARSTFLPSVTLGGNIYAKRGDAFEGNDWDTTLTVNVPLFSGLSDVGQLQQAKSQAIEADLRLSQMRRKALLEVRQAYTSWQSVIRRVDALAKALEASDKNYALQVDDFQKSLVNNLDVLQALEDLQSSRRDWVSAKAEAHRAYSTLKVSVGEID
ncbi:MAG: TolC family protein [Candidatus Omnitrophica bacterium]|nr:TolC family protein [Candidatus Omnitrophota bacterium]